MRMILLAATAFLSSCVMIPEYKRPGMPVEMSFPAGEAYKVPVSKPSTTTPAYDLSWNAFFQTPALQSIIQTALTNNRDLRVAALNIDAARAQYRIQRANLLPTIGILGSTGRSGLPENASTTGRKIVADNSSLNVGVTAFEIDLFGRVRSLSEAAMQQYLAIEANAKAVQISLIAEVTNAYLTYLADQKLLKVTNETLLAQQESYDVIQKSFALGIGTQQDVAQAATSVETARANIAFYTRRVAQDKNALVLLTGAPIADTQLNTITLDDVKVMDNLPVGLPSDILLTRPDIQSAEYQLKAANANIGAARAAFFPNISLTAAAGFASGPLSDLLKGDSRTAWNYQPQVSLPIFDTGRNKAGLEGAKASEEIAVANYEKAIQVAFREVSDELAARGTYTDQLNAQRSLVDATQKAYDIAEARFAQGIDSHLSVLDAQRSLYTAQQNEIIVQQQRLANLVNLYKVLGGGTR